MAMMQRRFLFFKILCAAMFGTQFASAQCPLPRIVDTVDGYSEAGTGTCGDKYYDLYYRIMRCQAGGGWNDPNPVTVMVRPSYLVEGACYSAFYNSQCVLQQAGAVPGRIRFNVAGCFGESGCFHVWWTTWDKQPVSYVGYDPPICCGGQNYAEALAGPEVETDFVYYLIVWP